MQLVLVRISCSSLNYVEVYVCVCKKTPGYYDHIWNPDLCSAHDFINFK